MTSTSHYKNPSLVYLTLHSPSFSSMIILLCLIFLSPAPTTPSLLFSLLLLRFNLTQLHLNNSHSHNNSHAPFPFPLVLPYLNPFSHNNNKNPHHIFFLLSHPYCNYLLFYYNIQHLLPSKTATYLPPFPSSPLRIVILSSKTHEFILKWASLFLHLSFVLLCCLVHFCRSSSLPFSLR